MSKISKITEKVLVKTNFIEFLYNISSTIYKPTSSTLIPLGRWKRDYHLIDTKIELANEDNCGVCNEYIKTKYKTNS